MKPSMLNLLLRGGKSYRDIAAELGMKKHRVQWFVLELERRGWIVVKRKIICLLDGTTSNAVNEYRRGKL
ncbi:MarR family transcriptional regulator [Cronobacter sakazakii]